MFFLFCPDSQYPVLLEIQCRYVYFQAMYLLFFAKNFGYPSSIFINTFVFLENIGVNQAAVSIRYIAL